MTVTIEKEDFDLILRSLKDIDDRAIRLTTGNVAHGSRTIANIARCTSEIIKEKYNV